METISRTLLYCHTCHIHGPIFLINNSFTLLFHNVARHISPKMKVTLLCMQQNAYIEQNLHHICSTAFLRDVLATQLLVQFHENQPPQTSQTAATHNYELRMFVPCSILVEKMKLSLKHTPVWYQCRLLIQNMTLESFCVLVSNCTTYFVNSHKIKSIYSILLNSHTIMKYKFYKFELPIVGEKCRFAPFCLN